MHALSDVASTPNSTVCLSTVLPNPASSVFTIDRGLCPAASVVPGQISTKTLIWCYPRGTRLDRGASLAPLTPTSARLHTYRRQPGSECVALGDPERHPPTPGFLWPLLAHLSLRRASPSFLAVTVSEGRSSLQLLPKYLSRPGLFADVLAAYPLPGTSCYG